MALLRISTDWILEADRSTGPSLRPMLAPSASSFTETWRRPWPYLTLLTKKQIALVRKDQGDCR